VSERHLVRQFEIIDQLPCDEVLHWPEARRRNANEGERVQRPDRGLAPGARSTHFQSFIVSWQREI
jgi:hypothetical protein